MMKRLPERVLLGVLAAQAVAYYEVAARTDVIPEVEPLSTVAASLNGWTAVHDFPLEKEVQEVLRADDTLNRIYVNADRSAQASLFIAFFKTQRQGQAPHSPKNCLPGAGWEPMLDEKIRIDLPGRGSGIQVNKYLIARGDEKSLVLYWYQSHDRAIAGEFEAKFWLVADAIRSRRSDTALVRVIVPVRNDDIPAAQSTAETFVRSMYSEIALRLPA